MLGRTVLTRCVLSTTVLYPAQHRGRALKYRSYSLDLSAVCEAKTGIMCEMSPKMSPSPFSTSAYPIPMLSILVVNGNTSNVSTQSVF